MADGWLNDPKLNQKGYKRWFLQKAERGGYMYNYTLDTVATGAKIKEIRTQKHITVSQICDHLGLCSEQAVYKWQRGESMPTVDNWIALLDLLDVRFEDVAQKRCIDPEYERCA